MRSSGRQINGLSDQFMGMSYDGVSSKDTGFGAANYVTPSLDSIAEVKIQTSNYQAEYGRAGGANIIVVTKSGSARFTGSAAYFKRHEGLNTNSWDRRRTCDATGGTSPLCATPRYRYDNSAFTLGGPVLSRARRSTRSATSCSSSTRWTSCRGPIRSW